MNNNELLKLFADYGKIMNHELQVVKDEWNQAKRLFLLNNEKIVFRELSISSLSEFMKIENLFLDAPGLVFLSSVAKSRWMLSYASNWPDITRKSIVLLLDFFDRLKRLGITVNIPECPEEIKEESAS